MRLAGGREVTLAVTRAQLTPAEAGTGEVAIVFRDVSQEEIVHRLLGYFIANVAHEFRTPLSALAASVELLMDLAPDLTQAEMGELLQNLHLGVLGPRRVVMEEDGNLPKPPYQLVDNDYSLLDETDLVFIDPMNTGYSRPVEGVKPKEWHGFKKDIQLVGDFIRLYTTRTNRWLSPKFLIGESYGTTRAAGLSGYLQERHGMYLNGIMLVSAVLREVIMCKHQISSSNNK